MQRVPNAPGSSSSQRAKEQILAVVAWGPVVSLSSSPLPSLLSLSFHVALDVLDAS